MELFIVHDVDNCSSLNENLLKKVLNVSLCQLRLTIVLALLVIGQLSLVLFLLLMNLWNDFFIHCMFIETLILFCVLASLSLFSHAFLLFPYTHPGNLAPVFTPTCA